MAKPPSSETQAPDEFSALLKSWEIKGINDQNIQEFIKKEQTLIAMAKAGKETDLRAFGEDMRLTKFQQGEFALKMMEKYPPLPPQPQGQVGQVALTDESILMLANAIIEINVKSRQYDRISDRSTFVATFRQRVMDYYKVSVCMVTGRPSEECIAAHIVPKSIDATEKRKLSESYQMPFKVNSARNGLLLWRDLENALDQLEICFIYNPIQKTICLKSLDETWQPLDGKKLTWNNDKAYPYRRAIRYQYEAAMESLTTHQIKNLFNNENPLQNLELSDKISEAADQEEKIQDVSDSSNVSISEPNKIENINLKPVWECTDCGLLNYENSLSCIVCFKPYYQKKKK